MSRRHIVIGSRSSKLAVIQAETVLSALSADNPGLKIELSRISTTGDRQKEISLEELGGEGVFVKELEEALLQGKIDIAVHSLKDMPAVTPAGLRLASVTRRIDPRDVMVSRAGKLSELSPGARIGTGSRRRSIQILARRADLEICGLRGNIDTRLRKAFTGELDGVVLAAAALIRLGREDVISDYFPPEHFVPAVGQGALGIEIRSGDDYISELVALINHEPTWQCITAERTLLHTLGGGCRAPIAALGMVTDGVLRLRGMVAGRNCSDILYHMIEGSCSAPEEAGSRLAGQMLEKGAVDLINGI